MDPQTEDTVSTAAGEARVWLETVWPPTEDRPPRGVIGQICERWGISTDQIATLRRNGVVVSSARAGAKRERVVIERGNLLRLITAAHLRRSGWSPTQIQRVDLDKYIQPSEDSRSWLRGSPAGRRSQAPSSLQQMIVHRVLRWVAGVLASEDNLALMPDDDSFAVVLREREKQLSPALEFLAPRLVTRDAARRWASEAGPGAVCRVDGSTSPYNAWISNDLARDLDRTVFPSASDQCSLFVISAASRSWEALVVCGHRPQRTTRSLSPREVNTILVLLQFLDGLVPALSGTVRLQPPSQSQNLLLDHYKRTLEHPLAPLALQLAQLPDAVLAAARDWTGCALLVPDTIPTGRRSTEELYLVAAYEGYSARIVQHSVISVREMRSLSARAYREQRTILLTQPTPDNVFFYEEERPSYAAAVPMGLGEFEGAKGAMYLFGRDERHMQGAAASLPAIEILANMTGQMIDAYYSQERLFAESYRVFGGGARDRLTRWHDGAELENRLEQSRHDSLPVIMLHLNFPEALRAEIAADALRIVHDNMEGRFASALRSIIGASSKVPTYELYTVYVLDREHYATLLVDAEEITGEQFYLAKTALARALRLVAVTDQRDEYFAWVRAGVISKSDANRHVDTGVGARLLRQQEHLFQEVHRVQEDIRDGNFPDALDRLNTLSRASPSGRLGWSCEDPAIVLERGRVLGLYGEQTENVQLVDEAVAAFECVPEMAWTGAARREYGFAVKTRIQLELFRFYGLDPAARAEERERVQSLISELYDKATRQLRSIFAHGPDAPTASTRRDAQRIATELDALQLRASKL